MANAPIDQNSRQALTALSSTDHTTIVPLYADPVTHRLLTDSAAASGTVTTVSVTTANGISGTVANATTTPSITLTLGAITPTSVNGLTLASQAIGFTIAGGTTSKTLTVPLDASVSGTNTGDNTVATALLSATTTVGVSSATAPTTGQVLTATSGTAATWQTPAAGGTGTVTSVSVVTANGISGTVANATTTPAITLAVATQAAGDSTTNVATTAFVQQAVRSVPSKEASKYATTTALATVTYYNGVANDGVGATLTGVGLGAITLDGNTPIVGDRLLVKNQASTFQNGIYTVTIVGTAGTVFVLTRALDFNQSIDIKTGASTYVTSGTTLAATTWDVSSADSPVMGTDAITFIQSAGPGSLIAGTGISITGVTVAVDSTIATLTGTQTLTNKTLTSPTLTTPALGTPASGVMTNVTGTATGLTAGLATNMAGGLGGQINYQSAVNTTAMLANGTAGQILSSQGTTLAPAWIANSVAISTGVSGLGTGVATALAVNVGNTTGSLVTVDGTQTLTNKRITPRVLSAASYTTDTGTSIAGDSLDMFIVTAQAGALLFNNPTGTPTDGQKLIITVASSTTTARALTWGNAYGATTVALPTTTAATTVTLSIGFIWSASKSLWQCVAVA